MKHRLDITLCIASKGFTDLDQTLDERIISHRHVRPDGGNQFLLADKAARVIHEVNQRLERFRTKLQLRSSPQQATAGEVERESVEQITAIKRHVHRAAGLIRIA